MQKTRQTHSAKAPRYERDKHVGRKSHFSFVKKELLSFGKFEIQLAADQGVTKGTLWNSHWNRFLDHPNNFKSIQRALGDLLIYVEITRKS